MYIYIYIHIFLAAHPTLIQAAMYPCGCCYLSTIGAIGTKTHPRSSRKLLKLPFRPLIWQSSYFPFSITTITVWHHSFRLKEASCILILLLKAARVSLWFGVPNAAGTWSRVMASCSDLRSLVECCWCERVETRFVQSSIFVWIFASSASLFFYNASPP